MRFRLLCLLLGLVAFSATAAAPQKPKQLKGVNIAGAEFAADKLPGEHAKDYIYPSAAIITAYAEFGVNVIRVPFLWERLQPNIDGKLDEAELARIDDVVRIASERRIKIILDMHNYGSFRGVTIEENTILSHAFARIWVTLAKRYKDNPYVIYGLMNEPYKQTATEWAAIAKEALLAIRATGAKQTILVPGTLYSGAHSWHKKAGKHSNAEALASLRDPANNMLIEFHHYFDYNFSGTHDDCMPPDVAEHSLMIATKWLQKTKHKGFLGEFGATTSQPCREALRAALTHMQKHRKQWAGWTYWGASEWFGDYRFNIYPIRPDKFPQLTVIYEFIK